MGLTIFISSPEVGMRHSGTFIFSTSSSAGKLGRVNVSVISEDFYAFAALNEQAELR